MAMTVSMAFAGTLSKEVILLGFCCALVYSVICIHNAQKDKDYELPKYTKAVLITISITAILISLYHYIIFLTVVAWILLGLIYNTIARFILFGDSTILAVTHFALPSYSASVILGINTRLALQISALFFFIAWFITQAKNLKDTPDDKKRKYVTLTTRFRKGALVSMVFAAIPFIFIVASFFIFSLSLKFGVILLITLIIIVIAEIMIRIKKEHQAIALLRLVFLVFMFGLIAEKTSDQGVILVGISLCAAYFIYLTGPYLHSILVKT
jgi:4-hydroxybenzoate polyprenyltransferase